MGATKFTTIAPEIVGSSLTIPLFCLFEGESSVLALFLLGLEELIVFYEFEALD